jgi:hypothetical protein
MNEPDPIVTKKEPLSAPVGNDRCRSQPWKALEQDGHLCKQQTYTPPPDLIRKGGWPMDAITIGMLIIFMIIADNISRKQNKRH